MVRYGMQTGRANPCPILQESGCFMTVERAIEVLIYTPKSPGRKLAAALEATVGDVLRDVGIADDLLVLGPDEEGHDNDADVIGNVISRDTVVAELIVGRVVTFHCHHCRHIVVEVRYQNETIHRKFSPSSRAGKVLRWAKRRLHLTDVDADNLALFEPGSDDPVRDKTHLGELVAGESCQISLDLSKDVNIEGDRP